MIRRKSIPVDNGVSEVPLTQGLVALIDTTDAHEVDKHSWCLQQYKDKSRHGGTNIYAKTALGGTQITLHRFLLLPPKELAVDHINGNSLDCRRENMRIASKQQNAANRPKDRVIKASSLFKGVHFSRQHKRWCARIYINGKGYHLGIFSTEIEAALVYDKAAVESFGCFARKNFL